MENLIEPHQITEQILNKLGQDYIRRYELKQSINPIHLKTDTLFLIEQLRLYNRSLRQLKTFATPFTLFEEKFNEVVFKVLQCLSKVIEKLLAKCSQLQALPKYQQPLCDLCGSNLHSKKIKNIQREIFDYFPILGREDLTDKENLQKGHHFQNDDLSSEQAIRKKMLALQRNLEDRQSGLERSIEEFESFRNDLIIGLPRLGGLDFDKFNIKQHVFQMSAYFHTNLKQIEAKLSGLKAFVRKHQHQSVQCTLEDPDSSKTNSQLESKLSALRAETEVKKLLQVKSKLQQGLKRSQIEITSLKEQLAELEQKNVVLKQQLYLQKIKKPPKERHNKPILFNWEEKPRKVDPILTETVQPPLPSSENDVANEISNQIAQIRSEIENSGAKMEELVPILKSSVKRAIDHFINHRMSSTLDRRKLQFDTNEQDSIDSTSKNKINGSSFKRVSNFHRRNMKTPAKQELSTEFSITTQLNYKIVLHNKPSAKRISIIDEKLLEGIEMKQKKAGSSVYKKSLMQTEGSLKPRRLKTTLSSVSSELIQNNENLSIHDYNPAEKKQRLQETSHFYQKSSSGNRGGLVGEKGKIFRDKMKGNLTANGLPNVAESIGCNLQGIYLGQSAIPELIQSKASKFSNNRRKKKNISCQDLTSLWRKQDLLKCQNNKQLIQIKKINGKKIPNELLLAFLKPKIKQECHKELKNQRKNQQIPKNQKEIKRQMTKVSNTSKQGQRKTIVALKLDEISFLTYFFTLLAKAHVSNASLYSDIRQEIICPFTKETESVNNQESMLRELVSDIIVQHRKCTETKEHQLCQHLSQFIDAFQACID